MHVERGIKYACEDIEEGARNLSIAISGILQ